uniref:SnoRNA binding domain, related n=1 Tax=Neospora caninum (strain Liverpool) TaxID=572307 RepID=A0A0F7UAK3_NEOCL|nr:TPA: SnoRNA binding domain, related [Neospora caninum Liverpool]
MAQSRRPRNGHSLVCLFLALSFCLQDPEGSSVVTEGESWFVAKLCNSLAALPLAGVTAAPQSPVVPVYDRLSVETSDTGDGLDTSAFPEGFDKESSSRGKKPDGALEQTESTGDTLQSTGLSGKAEPLDVLRRRSRRRTTGTRSIGSLPTAKLNTQQRLQKRNSALWEALQIVLALGVGVLLAPGLYMALRPLVGNGAAPIRRFTVAAGTAMKHAAFLGPMKASQKGRKRQQQMNRGAGARAGNETAGCGFSSSLTFTPIQGIELCNPGAAGAANPSGGAGKKQESTAKVNYFSSTGKFTKERWTLCLRYIAGSDCTSVGSCAPGARGLSPRLFLQTWFGKCHVEVERANFCLQDPEGSSVATEGESWFVEKLCNSLAALPLAGVTAAPQSPVVPVYDRLSVETSDTGDGLDTSAFPEGFDKESSSRGKKPDGALEQTESTGDSLQSTGLSGKAEPLDVLRRRSRRRTTGTRSIGSLPTAKLNTQHRAPKRNSALWEALQIVLALGVGVLLAPGLYMALRPLVGFFNFAFLSGAAPIRRFTVAAGTAMKHAAVLGPMKASQKGRKRQQQMNRGAGARAGNETAGCGFSSSLTFTPIQGIELCNPGAAGAANPSGGAGKKQESTAKVNYFSSTGKFTKERWTLCLRYIAGSDCTSVGSCAPGARGLSPRLFLQTWFGKCHVEVERANFCLQDPEGSSVATEGESWFVEKLCNSLAALPLAGVTAAPQSPVVPVYDRLSVETSDTGDGLDTSAFPEGFDKESSSRGKKPDGALEQTESTGDTLQSTGLSGKAEPLDVLRRRSRRRTTGTRSIGSLPTAKLNTQQRLQKRNRALWEALKIVLALGVFVAPGVYLALETPLGFFNFAFLSGAAPIRRFTVAAGTAMKHAAVLGPMKASQKGRKRQQQMNRGAGARAGNETAGCGFSSSLTFTPIQGIELCNPGAAGAANPSGGAGKKQESTAKVNYFSSTGKFTKRMQDGTVQKAQKRPLSGVTAAPQSPVVPVYDRLSVETSNTGDGLDTSAFPEGFDKESSSRGKKPDGALEQPESTGDSLQSTGLSGKAEPLDVLRRRSRRRTTGTRSIGSLPTAKLNTKQRLQKRNSALWEALKIVLALGVFVAPGVYLALETPLGFFNFAFLSGAAPIRRFTVAAGTAMKHAAVLGPMKASRKGRKRQQQMNRGAGARAGNETAGCGFSSSLTFTPIQGIELCNPGAAGAANPSGGAGKKQESTAKVNYFSSTGKFTKVEKDLASMVPKAV